MRFSRTIHASVRWNVGRLMSWCRVCEQRCVGVGSEWRPDSVFEIRCHGVGIVSIAAVLKPVGFEETRQAPSNEASHWRKTATTKEVSDVNSRTCLSDVPFPVRSSCGLSYDHLPPPPVPGSRADGGMAATPANLRPPVLTTGLTPEFRQSLAPQAANRPKTD